MRQYSFQPNKKSVTASKCIQYIVWETKKDVWIRRAGLQIYLGVYKRRVDTALSDLSSILQPVIRSAKMLSIQSEIKQLDNLVFTWALNVKGRNIE